MRMVRHSRIKAGNTKFAGQEEMMKIVICRIARALGHIRIRKLKVNAIFDGHMIAF